MFKKKGGFLAGVFQLNIVFIASTVIQQQKHYNVSFEISISLFFCV